jgi:hypothetical protein
VSPAKLLGGLATVNLTVLLPVVHHYSKAGRSMLTPGGVSNRLGEDRVHAASPLPSVVSLRRRTLCVQPRALLEN